MHRLSFSYKYLPFFLFFLTTNSIFGQKAMDSLKLDNPIVMDIDSNDLKQIQTNEDSLGLFAYLIVNDSLPDERFLACHQFIPMLVKSLKYKNSFQYPFEQLNSISIQYPADSSFRIFTWQLFVDDNTYKYYGAIQMNTPDLQLFPLVSRPEKAEAPEFEILSNKEWFGALYYAIHSFETDEGTKYLMAGYQQKDFFTKRKILEVISFQNGKPIFGAPVFIREDENDEHPPSKNRVIVEYYAGAGVRLNFDEVHEVILFDHLIEVAEPNGLRRLPDGSYEGYKLENGKWRHIVKVFDQISDEPPSSYQPPKDGKAKKDIFGKSK